ncbi:MAG: yhhT [Bacteroidota bacterium]|jgi:predicted PurR-regulated permease PerM|nr:yhhT [Bacteroidota bacterium]
MLLREQKTSGMPAYLAFSQITIGILAFFYLVYIGANILIPLVFALIFAILLNPMVNFMHRKGLNRILAIILAITIMLTALAAVIVFIGSQLTLFADAWPELKAKFNSLTAEAMNWFSATFKINKWKINSYIAEKKGETMNNAGSVIGGALTTISGFFIMVFLIPVYIFMFLFYKPLLLDFVAQIFKKDSHVTVAEVLANTKKLIQSYLVGLLLEMMIMATLNSVTLLIIGVDYAILFGIIGAILNLIPYIGGIVAISLPMTMALLTGTPMKALLVLGGYIIIQLIDNNYLVPKVVASKVKVNALISIIVVLIGGALWGVAGMFLSIPLTAICKVIFDRIEALKPIGFLIGDNMRPIGHDLLKVSSIKLPGEKKSPVKKKKTK